MVGIYKFINKINEKLYIGQSKNLNCRKKQHLKNAFNPNNRDYDCLFHRAIRKYGIDNFIFEVLEECDISDLNNREKYYIKECNSMMPFGYNMTIGGYSAIGTKLSLDDVENITKLLKETDISNKAIASAYSVGVAMIAGINTGSRWKRNIDYPIRKTVWKPKTLSSCDILEIINLIKNTDLSLREIGEKFGVKDHCISAINRGRAWKQENIEYPIRNSKFANKRYYE